ncbi:hypothetical protein PRZ48_009432 [Zasmidium cellare]|uniref:Major facilitator superfamily (MFS) profile domain-containing protein n=1 Tax=Zasmidium cellare TaxID=395010 RepID=A0ABR0EBP6_ZASCE|nr:hypothetical protein PRZ48_009432 [Zasmidium cellare]
MASLQEATRSYKDFENNTNAQWWRDPGLRRLVFWQACILLSQMTVGYDESVTGSLQSMQPWLDAMGNPTPSTIGLITASVFIAGFVVAFFVSPFADRYGRRPALLLGSSLCVVGAAIQSAAQNKGMFIGGRVLIGFGISFTTNAGPSLLNELAHPRMRGRIASSFNVLWYVGAIINAWLCFGTGHLSSNWSWRIPSLVQATLALLQVVSIFFMPESPRYLYSLGKHSEAQVILARYHANGVINDQLVTYQMTQIAETLALDSANNQKTWREVLKPKANRKRFAICLAVALLTLWNGQGVILYYFSPILDSIGITSTNQQTGINGGMQIWNLICSLVGAYLAESTGRRPLWLASFIGMICANVPLTISSAQYAKAVSKGAAYSTVVFLFLYNAAFNIACNPLLYSYTTELLPYNIRTKGLAIQVAVSQAALTVNQYVNPIALDSIGYWYFVLYLGMLLIGTAVIYFGFPETKGYTLEELANLFEEKDRLPILEAVVVSEGPEIRTEEMKSTKLQVKEADSESLKV